MFGSGAREIQQDYTRGGWNRLDKFEVCGYCDSNSKLWGQVLSGKPIVSPEEMMLQTNILVLICSTQKTVIQSVGEKLDEAGIEWHAIGELVCKLYRTEVMKCYDLLEDSFSKDTYAHIIGCHLTGELPEGQFIVEGEYFWLRQFKQLRNETFIDCGAYTGDTIEEYILERNGVFGKIIAFEPDKQNFAAMKYRVSRLKREWNIPEEAIQMFCCGVGADSHIQMFSASGTLRSMCLDESTCMMSENIDIVSLDQFIKEPYHFIKVDIEGYEYNMLMGAQEGICRNKPVLAVCIYHNAVDMFSIMLFLHQLVPEYKFLVRHHSEALQDTVLYAYV